MKDAQIFIIYTIMFLLQGGIPCH